MQKIVSIRLNDIQEYPDKPYTMILVGNQKLYIADHNILGYDHEVINQEAIRVPYWWARSRGLPLKKLGWIDDEGNIQPRISVERFVPDEVKEEVIYDNSLKKGS